ncbi:MAG: hypothetical protein LBD48_05475, partial [Treponema sp.]|nr:hypothetical protein [Treponema sp.]
MNCFFPKRRTGVFAQSFFPGRIMGLRYTLLSILFLLCSHLPVWSQAAGENGVESFAGMKLADLVGRFGAPKMVYTVRGIDEWQDDVVFVYDNGEFYIYRDRVWQVAVPAACGVKLGDHRAVVDLVLGQEAQNRGDHLLVPLSGGGWPLMLRVNINASG